MKREQAMKQKKYLWLKFEAIIIQGPSIFPPEKHKKNRFNLEKK